LEIGEAFVGEGLVAGMGIVFWRAIAGAGLGAAGKTGFVARAGVVGGDAVAGLEFVWVHGDA
jgi:hypothetical protein